jgi:hypothetical protein
MGREIRKIPADWQHPRWTEDDAPRSTLIGEFRPVFDKDYETAADEWVAEHSASPVSGGLHIRSGMHSDKIRRTLFA